MGHEAEAGTPAAEGTPTADVALGALAVEQAAAVAADSVTAFWATSWCAAAFPSSSSNAAAAVSLRSMVQTEYEQGQQKHSGSGTFQRALRAPVDPCS